MMIKFFAKSFLKNVRLYAKKLGASVSIEYSLLSACVGVILLPSVHSFEASLQNSFQINANALSKIEAHETTSPPPSVAPSQAPAYIAPVKQAVSPPPALPVANPAVQNSAPEKIILPTLVVQVEPTPTPVLVQTPEPTPVLVVAPSPVIVSAPEPVSTPVVAPAPVVDPTPAPASNVQNTTLIGTPGNDALTAVAGIDFVSGRAGNDTFIVNGSALALTSTNSVTGQTGIYIDGDDVFHGAHYLGSDTVIIAANSGSFTSAQLVNALHGIEVIDTRQTGINASMSFSAANVASIAGRSLGLLSVLTIRMNAGDSFVPVSGGGISVSLTINLGGQKIYTYLKGLVTVGVVTVYGE